jgi:hypothetical protein
VIDRTDPENPRVTDEVVYMTADEEDNYHVAQANEKLDEEGHFVRKSVSGRYRDETQEYDRRVFEYMDVSPKMVFSVATALIPFLQNDDANRALMGSNMQRQAVPLLCTEAPVVGTSMEGKTAVDSGVCVVAKHAGVVERSESKRIIIKCEDGTRDEYELAKLPYGITKYIKNGLEIRFVRDIGSYTKVIYALKEFEKSIVVTADDDIIYPKDWLKKLYLSYAANPEDIQVHRAHRVRIENKNIMPYETWSKHAEEESAAVIILSESFKY